MEGVRLLSDSAVQELVKVEPLSDGGEVSLLIMSKAPANALNREMLEQLTANLKRLEKDEGCRAVVITSVSLLLAARSCRCKDSYCKKKAMRPIYLVKQKQKLQ